jgi:hypothetical protein
VSLEHHEIIALPCQKCGAKPRQRCHASRSHKCRVDAARALKAKAAIGLSRAKAVATKPVVAPPPDVGVVEVARDAIREGRFAEAAAIADDASRAAVVAEFAKALSALAPSLVAGDIEITFRGVRDVVGLRAALLASGATPASPYQGVHVSPHWSDKAHYVATLSIDKVEISLYGENFSLVDEEAA